MGCIWSLLLPVVEKVQPPTTQRAEVDHISIIQLKHMFEQFGNGMQQEHMHFLVRVMCNFEVMCDDSLLPLHAVLVVLSAAFGSHAVRQLVSEADPMTCMILAYVYVPKWMSMYLNSGCTSGLHKDPVYVYTSFVQQEAQLSRYDVRLYETWINRVDLYLDLSSACRDDISLLSRHTVITI